MPPGSRVAHAERRRVALRLFDWAPWCRQVVNGVQSYAHESGKWDLFVDVGPAGSGRVLDRLSAWDGILTQVLSRSTNTRLYKRILREGSPKVVALTAFVPTVLKDMPSVRVNDYKVATAIATHLRIGGYRRFGYPKGVTPGVFDHRADALRTVAGEMGISCDFLQVTDQKRGPRSSLSRWIAQLEKPAGIVAWTMSQGREIIDACQAMGIAVPADVAVVAWDDDPMMAETLEPTISAAVLPAERLGYEAAKLLEAQMSGERIQNNHLLVDPPGLLRIRQSSDVSTLKDRDVYLAAQFIRERGTESLRISDVATAMQVSRRKLEQDFKRVTGKTLHEAIVDRRMETAKRLLIETAWPLDRIADKTGMGTRKTLHEVFKKQEAMTPAQYRERYRGH